MIKINLKKNRGFTLLEALVATSVLMVAIAAPITIAQKGLSSAVFTKNQMIASYLAQDVIEYMKNSRDEMTINDPDNGWTNLWGGKFSACVQDKLTPNNGCQIDTIPSNLQNFQAVNPFSSANPLYIDNNGFYIYNAVGNTKTNFTRQVEVELHDIRGLTPPTYDEALITVTVKWGENNNKVVVQTLIYND